MKVEKLSKPTKKSRNLSSNFKIFISMSFVDRQYIYRKDAYCSDESSKKKAIRLLSYS